MGAACIRLASEIQEFGVPRIRALIVPILARAMGSRKQSLSGTRADATRGGGPLDFGAKQYQYSLRGETKLCEEIRRLYRSETGALTQLLQVESGKLLDTISGRLSNSVAHWIRRR